MRRYFPAGLARCLLPGSLVLLLSSCGGNTSPDSPGGVPEPGVFRLNLSAAVSTLDPAFADNQSNTWAAVQLFNGLIRLGDQLQLEPDLARSWAISDDGLSYTFALRRDAWFHPDPVFLPAQPDSMRAMTADDVVYSFQRLMDPATGANGFWVFNGVVDPEGGIMALNDSTLQIRLLRPFEPFLSRLAMPYCSVMAREAGQAYGAELRRHPVGTGPFRLGQWREGESLTLLRHPRYFGRDASGNALPYLDAVRFRFLAAKGTEFLQFRNGELDFVSDLDPSFLQKVLHPEGGLQPEFQDVIELKRGLYLNTEYLGINLREAEGTPLADERIRRALSLGIDRERMIAFQRFGKGIPAEGGMVPPSLLGVQSNSRPAYGYRFDPQAAERLLAEAGYPGGRGMPELLLRTNDQYLDLCLFLQAQWKELGIPVQVENLDGKVLRESMIQGQSLFFRASWIADYPDAESYLALFYGGYGAPPNYTRSRMADFDALYEAAVQERDAATRTRLYRAMDSLVARRAPVIPLYYDEVILLHHPWVQGLETNALNLLRLERVQKKPAG
jgi:oligopeptide transport system substrate-binding protein